MVEKKARKRAADFMDGADAEKPINTKKQKSVKIVEPVPEVEAVEEEDLGGALLTGFDSDGSDDAKDEGLDVENLGGIPNYKKTKKKLRKAEEKGGPDKPGTVYIGRVPHGFFEQQMREYFSQFGDITRLRLSRNKRTGASKHFAFIEFKLEEVAKIVAETMDNYLMFGHILKCKFAPDESLHPNVWKGANTKYRKIPHAKLEQARLTAPQSEEKWRQRNEREQKRRDKKARLLKDKMGYDMPQATLADPATAIEANKLLASDAPKAIENGDADQHEAPTLPLQSPEPEPQPESSVPQKKPSADSDAGPSDTKKERLGESGQVRREKKGKKTEVTKQKSAGNDIKRTSKKAK